MGVLSGAVTARRLAVVGEVPEGFRELYAEALNDNAFREPPSLEKGQVVEGWVQIHNLLDTDFSNLDKWLYNNYAIFALRTDKKSLPAKLFRATLEKKLEEWCEEHERERVPASVKTDIREALEADWLKRTLPRVGMTELCWNITTGEVTLHSHSDSVLDAIRKRFHRTFGLQLVRISPLDAVKDEAMREQLMSLGLSELGGSHE